MKRLALILAVALALALAVAGCGSSRPKPTATQAGSTTPSAASATASATATAVPNGTKTDAAGCTTVSAPTPKRQPHLSAPTTKLDPAKTYTVTVVTNCGTFAFTLDVKQQPRTSASVYTLVKSGFYNDLTFLRVAADFVIQGGDPLDSGAGGPGYTVVESPPKDATYPLGTVAMAKTGAQPDGASGSQFFVMTGSSGLPPQYAIAGKVTSGLSVVERIGSIPSDPEGDGAPTIPVVMSSVTVKVSS